MKCKIYYSRLFCCWCVIHPEMQGDGWGAQYTGMFIHWQDAWNSVFKPKLYSNITCKDLTNLDSDISCI